MKKMILSILALVILLAGLPISFVSAAEGSPKAKIAVEPGRKQFIPDADPNATEDDLISDDELEEISEAEWDKLPTVEEDGTVGPVPQGPVVKAQRISKILKLLQKPHVKEVKKGKKVKRYTEKHTNSGIKYVHIKNGKLAGQKHPVTKVPFTKQGFPIFNSTHTMTLPLKELKSSNYTQFKLANASLKKKVNSNITLMGKFTKAQLKEIDAGKTPTGYTWHHHEQVGRMQLVDTWKHEKTGHTGGRSIWGSFK
ncbi:HNH endonuclease [Bacillus pumilus]|nr:HNH endonuclease [Bacillus pumilus]MCK6184515.1 HNH endonuclease [Bacillus pumilus]PRS50248.1 hypothetical protein C6Y05_10595 [Bacillus sp. LNXM10]